MRQFLAGASTPQQQSAKLFIYSWTHPQVFNKRCWISALQDHTEGLDKAKDPPCAPQPETPIFKGKMIPTLTPVACKLTEGFSGEGLTLSCLQFFSPSLKALLLQKGKRLCNTEKSVPSVANSPKFTLFDCT